MKKISYVLASLATLAAFSSCEKQKPDINLDDIVLDGFYVYGDATGAADKVLSINSMSAGFNEVDKATRQGMYEKYIWLEADKEFALIENSAGNKKFYGAELVEVNYGYDENDPECKNFADNPNMKILQGQLIIGETAPKMTVKETGMYHIVLDNNTLGDLQFPQIIVQRAKWGVRGGMNGWGFTEAEEVRNNDGSIVYTLKDQELATGGEFKFASCWGWKINLDEENKVKAEVSLGAGETAGKPVVGPTNIAVEKAGLYDITLTYVPKAGAIADSFTYSVTLTKESDLPTEMYMTGTDFGNWTWGADGVVSFIPAHSEPGAFWAIRYLTANNGVKFSSINVAGDWSKAFGSLTTNEGCSTDGDGNCVVAEDGLYMIEIDMKNSALYVHPAEVYGMGDAFGGWDEGAHPYTIEGRSASISAAAAGNMRTYAKSVLPAAAENWWHREFVVSNGKIVYRAAGGELEAVALSAGQTVTLDFNAGTGTIE